MAKKKISELNAHSSILDTDVVAIEVGTGGTGEKSTALEVAEYVKSTTNSFDKTSDTLDDINDGTTYKKTTTAEKAQITINENNIDTNSSDITDLETTSLNKITDDYLEDVVAGTNVTIDKTDPKNPIISASGGSGSGNVTTSDTLGVGEIVIGNGSEDVASSDKTIVTTLGGDDTTIPTSKAVADAIGSGGGGDMTKAIYDPTNVNGDAFDMDNMVETATSKVMTEEERDAITRIPTPTGILQESVSIGDILYISGNASGTRQVAKADRTDDSKFPASFIAIEDGLGGEEIKIARLADIPNLNTNGMSINDNAYLDVDGGFTNIRPTSNIQHIGYVSRIGFSDGGVCMSMEDPDYAQQKFNSIETTVSVSPAIPFTHYLVDATSGDIIISLPDVVSGDESEYKVTLTKDTNKVTVTTVGGTQLIGEETSILNHTVNGSLYIRANGVDGYNLEGDSRTYYRVNDFSGGGSLNLSTSGYESGSVYHFEPGTGNTRTVILPDDPSDFTGFWAKFLLDGDGTVIIKTLSSNLIAGVSEVDITNDGGAVEITSFGDHYGITQDSRPKVQNVGLLFLSLGEDSTVTDPDAGYSFYKQTANSIEDSRYDKVTAVTSTTTVSGQDVYGGGLIGDPGVIGGLLPEGPAESVVYCRTTNGSDFTFYVEYYKWEDGGIETLIGTSTASPEVKDTSFAEFRVTATLPATTFGPTDRLLRKVYYNDAGGGIPIAEFSAEGPNPSFTQIAIGASSITHNTLGGIEQAGDGITYGHIDDQAQTIKGLKTFEDGIIADNVVQTDPTGVTGADAVTNMMSLTQAEYDAITPNASTVYYITDA